MKEITLNDYLMNRTGIVELSPALLDNSLKLIERTNKLLEKFGEYRKVSSGFRNMKDHLRIYKEKNELRKKQGLPELKVPQPIFLKRVVSAFVLTFFTSG